MMMLDSLAISGHFMATERSFKDMDLGRTNTFCALRNHTTAKDTLITKQKLTTYGNKESSTTRILQHTSKSGFPFCHKLTTYRRLCLKRDFVSKFFKI